MDEGNHEARYVCENQNICDRDEVYEPVTKAKTQKKHAIRKPTTVKAEIPENAIKIAMITDVHVEHQYSEVSV